MGNAKIVRWEMAVDKCVASDRHCFQARVHFSPGGWQQRQYHHGDLPRAGQANTRLPGLAVDVVWTEDTSLACLASWMCVAKNPGKTVDCCNVASRESRHTTAIVRGV